MEEYITSQLKGEVADKNKKQEAIDNKPVLLHNGEHAPNRLVFDISVRMRKFAQSNQLPELKQVCLGKRKELSDDLLHTLTLDMTKERITEDHLLGKDSTIRNIILSTICDDEKSTRYPSKELHPCEQRCLDSMKKYGS